MSQPKNTITENDIREMAKLTLVSNKINEIQIKNLKMFPLVFFEGVKNVVIEYDLLNNQSFETEENQKELEISYKFNNLEMENFKVSYYLTMDDSFNTMIDKRFSALENAVHGLFWKQVRIEVYFNKKLVYESNKNARK